MIDEKGVMKRRVNLLTHDVRFRLDDRLRNFIVSADIARNVGSPGWLMMVWLIRD
jgi:hypothetical protein